MNENVFIYKGKQYSAHIVDLCSGCAFNNYDKGCQVKLNTDIPSCISVLRQDGNEVIFKEVI